MEIGDLERQIDEFISRSGNTPALQSLISEGNLDVVKYMPAAYLENVLARGQLYAAERAGFTWGDAVYVAPLSCPLTTMMYGEVGVVGTYRDSQSRFFDASDPAGIRLYQEWIVQQTVPYLDLTTTVHANVANRELRNAFHTRFQIDCVYFRPDEHCVGYVNAATDWWLAITHWDAYRAVGHGFSGAITGLKWCVVVPDAFKSEGRGYTAFLRIPAAVRSYPGGHYSSLEADIRRAYASATDQVVICDFD